MRVQGGLSNIQFGWESNSLEINSLARKVSTHHARYKLVLSKIPKENSQNDKNPFSFLMKYFIILIGSHKVEFYSIWFLQLILVV